ncbi:MAG TPA: cupin domain-containing protein [Beijerinckiaceae bacterium]|jgi:mannose-6-phosphate isomerase-like protein (cupin superfamily)|nr:cupin domain-containing protein [Beijerinckiaceae bacterium]
MDDFVKGQVAPTADAIGTSGATKFSMRGLPLLSQGASFDAVATAENLWLSVKVYSSGGENALHVHTVEDHAFVVLQGRATFYFGDDSIREVLQYEGVMLPKGTSYRFQASEEENLVLLRIGAAQRKTQGIGDLQRHGTPMELKGTTFDEDGTAKVGRGGVKKTPNPPIIPIPGKFFPKDM